MKKNITKLSREKRYKKQIKELQKLLKHYKSLSLLDELTGLYNRRKLNRDVKKFLARTKRYNTRYTVIMFDIDHFKKINDTKGHKTGDKVLRKISNVLQYNIRQGENAYRLSGDEFVLIIQGQEPFSVIKRIENKLAKFNIQVSYGIAPMQKEVLDFVDKKMYSFKRRKQ